MAKIAFELNTHHENIGARRLQSIIEKIVEDISFNSTNFSGQVFIIDAIYVNNKLKDMNKITNLSKYLA
jgi:ATP-dependent HslUV protease ATP-binding subunit HslU